MAVTKQHGGKRTGAGKKPVAGKRLPNGSIRMSVAQWKQFELWGGAARLRAHLDHMAATAAGKATVKRVRAPA